jgi:fructuronate reductase
MKLNRANLATMNHAETTKATERIVHIGLGAFHRAHQAWYTSRVDREQNWGIVAFTGRSIEAAEKLSVQDGLYTLITRDSNGDSYQIIDSIVRAEDGNDTEAFVEAITNSKTVIVTLTITEAGYGMDSSGHVDSNNPPPALHRLAVALETRRRANGLGIAIVSCDNMPSNGALLKIAMGDLFASFGSDSVDWLNEKVSFVSTSIDRITPKTTDEDLETVKKATGWEDNSPVVTEPFSDWVLQGEFPLGRPQWERAGAKFVEDIEPFENRKLWLLNGSHSLMAYLGQLRGHETVAQAIADEFCLEQVDLFWDEAEKHLTDPGLEIPKYRQALLERFSNERIAHRLAQIAIDGATKLRVRIAPVAKAELGAGRLPKGAASAIAAWVSYVLKNEKVEDAKSQEIGRALSGPVEGVEQRLVSVIDLHLANDEKFMSLVIEQLSTAKI